MKKRPLALCGKHIRDEFDRASIAFTEGMDRKKLTLNLANGRHKEVIVCKGCCGIPIKDAVFELVHRCVEELGGWPDCSGLADLDRAPSPRPVEQLTENSEMDMPDKLAGDRRVGPGVRKNCFVRCRQRLLFVDLQRVQVRDANVIPQHEFCSIHVLCFDVARHVVFATRGIHAATIPLQSNECQNRFEHGSRHYLTFAAHFWTLKAEQSLVKEA